MTSKTVLVEINQRIAAAENEAAEQAMVLASLLHAGEDIAEAQAKLWSHMETVSALRLERVAVERSLQIVPSSTFQSKT